MNEKIDICEIAEKDINNVVLLFDKYRQFYDRKSNVDEAKSFLKYLFDNKKSIIFIAKLNSDIVGFVNVYPSYSSVSMSKIWVLNDLYVEAEYRNQKIAHKLIEKVHFEARHNNISSISLETAKSNTIAQNLYKKYDYVEEKELITFHCNI